MATGIYNISWFFAKKAKVKNRKLEFAPKIVGRLLSLLTFATNLYNVYCLYG